ncbi:MAG: FAD-dependent oxidoreductase [Fuerstiella sp.]
MKIVIIGGVAGGASAAARARRLNEDAEITVFERGPYPSFANCGLPYYVGGKIEARKKLLVAPIELLQKRHRLDVRVLCEVTSIDREAKQVSVHNLATGERYEKPYDKLILATGAASVQPSIPGGDGDRILGLRDLLDADRLHKLATSGAKRAVMLGAGFIGIEVAENLVRRNIDVTIVELADQILPPWDQEMVSPLQQHLSEKGIDLRLKDSIQQFEEDGDGLKVSLKSGDTLKADFAVVSVGVRPESRLAKAAGLECSDRGGVLTNSSMQTSDRDIYAVGDVVEVDDFVTKNQALIPLAGPANRQGRIAADHLSERSSAYRGTQGTSIVGFFDRTIAMTGQSEKGLRRQAIDYEKIYVHPADHAGYYPGANGLTLKLLFNPKTGLVLGAQCVGSTGIDKRIDVIAMAIQAGMTVFDLEEVELCYAPQFGSAKDPVNMAGFVAAGVVRGDHPVIHAKELAKSKMEPNSDLILDVRTPAEFDAGSIPGAMNIPVDELRERLNELPSGRNITVYCKVGMRGYLATRILLQNEFSAHNLSGGFTTWQHVVGNGKN